MMTKRNFLKLKTLAIAIVALLVSSCGSTDPLSPGTEFMPDMYTSPAYKPYEENANFQNSPGALPVVQGTISQGSIPNSAWNLNSEIYPYPNTPEGYEMAGLNLKNPILLNPQVIEEGKDLYTKFCTHCHGDAGDGNGSIVANGKFPSPGKYWDKVAANGLNEGKMFHSITYGKGLMGQHASQLNKEERWKIIHYIQELNKAAQPAPATAAVDSTNTKKEEPKK